jgi:hypothetical protein
MDYKEKNLIKKIILFALPFIGLLILFVVQYLKGRVDVEKYREQSLKERQIENAQGK